MTQQNLLCLYLGNTLTLFILADKREGSSRKANNLVCPSFSQSLEGGTIAEELGTLEESSATQIIDNVFASLDLEGSDPAIVPLEGDEEVGIDELSPRKSHESEASRQASTR